MAAYITFQPKDYFSTNLYVGDGTTSNAITGIGFSANFTWLKNMDQNDMHKIFDTVRGATERLTTDGTSPVQTTEAETLKSWQSDGFTVGSDAAVNTNTENFVSWNWKEATIPGLDIIEYTGNATAGRTVAHNLGAIPECIWTKNTDDGGADTGDWWTYQGKMDFQAATPAPEDYYMKLNQDEARFDNTTAWNDTAPDASNFTVGSSTNTNSSGDSIIAYCWRSVRGFSSFNCYVGNGSTDGPYCFTGFRPAYVLVKRINAGSGGNAWSNQYCFDDKRAGYNVTDKSIDLRDSSSQTTSADYQIDILANGFKVRTAHARMNESAAPYMFSAFARFPMVSSNDVPGVAR